MIGYDRVQLKQTARAAMKAQRPHPMLVTFLFLLIANIGSQLICRILAAASGFNGLTSIYTRAILQDEDPSWAIQYALLSFGATRLVIAVLVGGLLATVIASLWVGMMRVGYSGFCLSMVRKQQPQTGALFSAFPQWAGVLLTQFLVGLFECLWGLLFGVSAGILIGIFALLFADVPGLLILLFLAIYIAMLVGIVWVTLRYAMVDFLIADQGLTGMEAIQESKRLMQGNIGRLFVLRLSFIGWYLLESAIILVAVGTTAAAALSTLSYLGSVDPLTLIAASGAAIGSIVVAALAIGIFSLWLTPYITGSQALFYDWARGGNKPGTAGGFGGQGGWGQPQPPQQHYDYNWNPGPSSGTGIGPGPQDGGSASDGSTPKPKDDPWD